MSAIYALWIPSLNGILSVQRDQITGYNISDTDISPVDAVINRDNFEVCIIYTFREEKHTIEFELFESLPGSFLPYQIKSQSESDSVLARTLTEKFHQSLYHLFKSFFHDHSFHSDEEDSILHAVFFPSEKEYVNNRGLVFESFIEEYLQKFEVYRKHINFCNDQIQKLCKTERDRITHYLPIFKAHKRMLEIFFRYDGEYLYCQSLMECAKKASFDTESYSQTIRAIEDEMRVKQRAVEQDLSYNAAIIGTNVSSIGMAVGVVGIVISFIVSCWSDPSQRKLDCATRRLDSMERKIGELRQSAKSVNQSAKANSVRMDSVAESLDSVKSSLNTIIQQNKRIQRQTGVK